MQVCKRLVPSRLHELHESKFPFVSRIEFIRSKLSNFSAHVYGVTMRHYPGSTRRVLRVGGISVISANAASACYRFLRVVGISVKLVYFLVAMV